MDLSLELAQEAESEELKAKIMDFDEHYLYITYPIGIESNRIRYLSFDDTLFVTFTDKESGATYLYKTKIIKRIKKEIPLLSLPYPSEHQLMKIQRRQFVRVNTAIDLSLHFPERSIIYPTVTYDLSGGGCAVVVPEDINIVRGDIGKVYIVLPFSENSYSYIQLNVRAIRKFEKNKVHLLSLQFFNLNNRDQQQLIRYTFEKQLEYRNKGYLVE